MRRLANHGVVKRPEQGPWAYVQVELGFNYRMNEMEAALGLSQLGKLDRFVSRRQALAARYDRLLEPFAPEVRPVSTPAGQRPSPHIYTVLIDFEAIGVERAALVRALGRLGIGVQVHYIPLYRQPFFRHRYGAAHLPGAEAYYARCLALPLFPAMADAHVDQVVLGLAEVLGRL
jgi:dTDP-4-amino-4,6-dideoxygalactose transaminase